jgi:hypothetical protein
MVQGTISLTISIVSSIIAVISLFFAWRAGTRADKAYSLQVITQIFNTYNSPSMRKDLQVVWKLYRQIWQSLYKDNPEKAVEKTNAGIPITEEAARKFFHDVPPNSPKYKAIDNVLGFWDYIAVLLSSKNLSIRILSAFLTPRILGFLYPIERAKADFYGYKVEPHSSLQSLYELWKRKYPDTF